MKPNYKVESQIPKSRFVKYLAIYNYPCLNTVSQLALVENSTLLKWKNEPNFIGIWKIKKI